MANAAHLPAPTPTQLAAMYTQIIAWVEACGGALYDEIVEHIKATWGHVYRAERKHELNRVFHLLFVIQAFDTYTATSHDGKRNCNFYTVADTAGVAPAGFSLRAWPDHRGAGFDGAPVDLEALAKLKKRQRKMLRQAIAG